MVLPPKGELKKTKLLSWDDKQRLEGIEFKDSSGKLFIEEATKSTIPLATQAKKSLLVVRWIINNSPQEGAHYKSLNIF